MQIAITGATGFLGRYIVRRLAGAGHRLRCWYRPLSDRSGFEDAADSIEWLPGEMCDGAARTSLVRGADALIHAAVEWKGSRNRVGENRGSPDLFFDTNLTGSLRLFEAAFQSGVPRCIFISSCAVHDVILADRPLDETHPLWPKSHYGAHKAALEAFVHSFGLGQGWPICALRPTGIYGLAQPASASRWYEVVGQIVRGEPVASEKGGKEVHAADVARAVELLLNADATAIAGQAYNCYDRYVAEQDVARIAKELTGSTSSIADLNRGPKNQIDTRKLKALGMTFGGEPLLRRTVEELLSSYDRYTQRHGETATIG
jgi:nucleoside-diphosphate-sugar epimerase